MNRWCATCAAAWLAAAAGLLSAQQTPNPADVEPLPKSEPGAIDDADDDGGLSIEGTFFFPTSYVFRGYVIEEDHFLFQPDLTLSIDTEVGGFAVTPYFNAWFNFTDAPAPGDPEWFNEINLALGAEIELGGGFSAGVTYIWYNSPADVFDDIHEIGVSLSHENLLNPSVAIYRELDNRNGEENTYIELSIIPGWDVPQIDQLHFDFPVVLGLSPDEYFTDSDGDGYVFGYISGGVVGTFELTENWSIAVGVDYIQMLADSTEDSNDGDEHQIVGHAGLAFAY